MKKQDFQIKFNIPDLTIIDFNNWVVSLRPEQVTLGSLVISLKRECKSFAFLSDDETQELALVYRKTEDILYETFKCDKINYLALMMVDEFVHIHVFPRYSENRIIHNLVFEDKGWPGPPFLEGMKLTIDELLEIKGEINSCLSPPKKIVIGYTTGVFDLFHIGHLNLLKNAKKACDYLITGVTTDQLVEQRKFKKPVIELKERIAIIEALRVVDKVVEQDTMDKFVAWEKYRFDKMFVGSDWKGTEKWNQLEFEFKKLGVEIIYFPYTEGTSSSIIRDILGTYL